jgi:hypothetical protein
MYAAARPLRNFRQPMRETFNMLEPGHCYHIGYVFYAVGAFRQENA